MYYIENRERGWRKPSRIRKITSERVAENRIVDTNPSFALSRGGAGAGGPFAAIETNQGMWQGAEAHSRNLKLLLFFRVKVFWSIGDLSNGKSVCVFVSSRVLFFGLF